MNPDFTTQMNQSTPPLFYSSPRESPITLARNLNNFKVLVPMPFLKIKDLNTDYSSPIIVSENTYVNLKIDSHYQSGLSTNSKTRKEKLVSDLTLTKSCTSDNTNDRVNDPIHSIEKLLYINNDTWNFSLIVNNGKK